MKHIAGGNEVCIAITLLDGLVLARSVFSHSANYRSVVLFGTGAEISDPGEKVEALQAFTERLLPGRWDDARQPNEKELKATTIVSIQIELASAKSRQGPPGDEPEDYELDVWAGVLPIRQVADEPDADPKLKDEIALPGYIQSYALISR
jgi:nitroimidazol reductase NimA-like FMN-containing flavoprotein (pyridoxamine 5'-phosphate oxidase superfamily)